MVEIILQENCKLQLDVLHLPPLHEIHHVRAEEDHQGQEDQLCRVLIQNWIVYSHPRAKRGGVILNLMGVKKTLLLSN